MKKLIFPMAYLIVCLSLSSCSLNHGFPREITGSLKPINNVEGVHE